MQCDSCGTNNPAPARFCMGCGRILVNGIVCSTCHTTLPPQAQYCYHCGNYVAQFKGIQRDADTVYSVSSVPTPLNPAIRQQAAENDQDIIGNIRTTGAESVHAVQDLTGGAKTKTRNLKEMQPSLETYLPDDLFTPFLRVASERDLMAARDHLTALLATAKTYLPKPVIENPQPAGNPLGGMNRGVFLFGDVSGFTPLSEKLKALGQVGAEQITELINALFTDLVTVLFNHGGTLLKFGGDALLGLFEAESEDGMAESALRAAQAALAMQDVLKKDRFSRIEAMGEKSSLQIKCGISAGAYFAAHIGLKPSEENRNGTMAFVTTGHTVNLAEEAEGHAHPGEIAVTRSVAELLGERAQLDAVNREPDENYRRLIEVSAQPVEQGASIYQPEIFEGDVRTQIGYLVERLDLLTPYLSDELVARIVTNPKDARIMPDHRPVTVMFANYKGISRLIEKHGTSDPSLITHHLNSYFVSMASIVEKYKGTLARMDQYAVGDRLVIFFGAPRAHEDDPARAVYTALEMQDAVREKFSALRTSTGVYRFEQRIGINTGHLFAGNAGAPDLRQEYTLMGDDINMAARLMSNAPWGEIFISRRTKDHVKAYFELQDRGELKVKGKEIRIPTYSVTGRKIEIGQTRGLESGESPLVGREDEMAQLQVRGQMLLRRRGSIVVLSGNSGLGKSRLMREFHKWIAGQPEGTAVIWIDGKALSFSEQMSYWVAGQILRGILDIKQGAQEEDVLYILGEFGEKLLGDEAMSAVPYLAYMLNLELGEEWGWVKKEDPKVRQKQIQWATASLVGAFARSQPVIIALDDLHWADENSLSLIEHLLQVTDQAPVMFLLMFRPQMEKGSWRLRNYAAAEYPHRYQELLLDPLSYDTSSTLLERLLPGAKFQPDINKEILEKAAGNPYYLEEVVRSLIESGAVVEAPENAGTWQITSKIAEIAVPATLHAAIIARIDRLTEDARLALQTVSVIGRQFRLNLFRNIAEAEAEIEIWVSQLEQGGLIKHTEISLDPIYVFPDALVQEVAYESLVVKSRQKLHARLGETLEGIFSDHMDQGVDLLAFHYSRSEDDDKALKYLELAAKKARGDYANETAIQYYGAMLAIYRKRKDGNGQAGALYQMGVMAYEMGDYDRARPWLDEAVGLYRELADGRNEGWSVMYLGMVDLKRANYSESAKQHRFALEQALQRGDLTQEGIHLTNLARVTMRTGRYEQAQVMFEQSLTKKKEQNDLVGQGFSYYYLAMIHIYQGDYSQAEIALAESIKMWEQVAKNDRGMAYCRQGLGLLAFGRQQYEQALAYLQDALGICERLVLKAEMIENLSWLSQVYLCLNQLPQAQEASEQAMKLLVKQRDVEEVQQIYLNHYRVRKAMNDPKAESYLQKAADLMQEQGTRILDEGEREIFFREVRVNQEIREAANRSR